MDAKVLEQKIQELEQAFTRKLIKKTTIATNRQTDRTHFTAHMETTYCQTTLLIRGWDLWLINTFLGPPDIKRQNIYNPRHPEKRWLKSKVLQAEKDPLVQAYIQARKQAHKTNKQRKQLKKALLDMNDKS